MTYSGVTFFNYYKYKMRAKPTPARPAASHSLPYPHHRIPTPTCPTTSHSFPPFDTIARFHKKNNVGSQRVQGCPLLGWLTKRAEASPSYL